MKEGGLTPGEGEVLGYLLFASSLHFSFYRPQWILFIFSSAVSYATGTHGMGHRNHHRSVPYLKLLTCQAIPCWPSFPSHVRSPCRT